MKPEDILAEVEDVLGTMPPRPTLRDLTPENFGWLGRVMAVLRNWNPDVAQKAYDSIKLLQGIYARESESGFGYLMILLNEVRSDLRMRTLGPINTAIGHGFVFDYFNQIRKLIALANKDVLFVDPYLDAEFVEYYLPQVPTGVVVRLLTREKLASLVPALKLFAKQSNARLELRSATNFHDRYMIIDGVACYQSGASFKDGARTAPTTITQITDAFSAVQKTYEDLWRSAKTEL